MFAPLYLDASHHGGRLNHDGGVAVIVGERLDAKRLSHSKPACPSSVF